MPGIMDFLGLPDWFVEIQLCGDKEIARLNMDFLGLPGPTNVLSFPVSDQAAGCQNFLGQICISLQAVQRESVLYSQPPREHMLRLLLHGMLHLAGYAHGQEMQACTEQGVEHFAAGT